MKRTFILVLATILMLTTLCSCSITNTTNSTEGISNSTDSNNTNANTQSEIDISSFKEVKASKENIDIYRQEVSSRIQSLKPNDSFITDKEWKVISESKIDDTKVKHFTSFTTVNSLYEITCKYYYPVVFRDAELLVLWYTNESGLLFFKVIYGDGVIKENYGGEVHYDGTETKISIKHDQAVTYSQETGEIKILQFGQIVDSFDQIPQNSIYCGYSKLVGYIFRNISDVYSLKYVNDTLSLFCIGHDVKYVISVDYCYNSDYWSQPIFQMLDGRISVYVNLGNENNDRNILKIPQYEGGYNK